MPITIVRNDITKMHVDAIVNSTNAKYEPGGGVDRAIHKAAGTQLAQACAQLTPCDIGEARITPGFALPAKYIIHTVGPLWKDGPSSEKQLINCYQASLKLAKDYACESIAFPLISSGAYGYPKQRALSVAMDTIQHFLEDTYMEVYVVVFDTQSFQIGKKIYLDVQSYIDDVYVEKHLEKAIRNRRFIEEESLVSASYSAATPLATFEDSMSLEEELENLDESFSQMLLRKIDEAGMKDSECYKKANIDRKLFSKIRSDIHYRPSKQTALSFAIALELSLTETNELLLKAGYALSHSNKADVIIEYFIRNHNYNIFEINEVLFAFDQKTLG